MVSGGRFPERRPGASQQAARLLSTSATDMAEASARNLRGQLVGVSAVRDEKVSVGEAQR